MRKKDIDKGKQAIRETRTDPEHVDGPIYEQGHVTAAELRRRHLVLLRHSAGIQLVAAAALLPLTADAARHGHVEVALLALAAASAGIAGASYGWTAYGRIARLVAEGAEPSGHKSGRVRGDGLLHALLFAVPALAASLVSSVPMYTLTLIACSIVAYGACKMMWSVVEDELAASGGDTGDDAGRD